MSGYLQGKDMAGGDKPGAGQTGGTKAVTIPSLNAMRAAGTKIAMLTCYDASFASLMDRCGVEVLLIGDSLGMVCNGHQSTLPVTVAEVAYHTAAVARGNKSAMVVADMPFGTYAHPGSGLRQRGEADPGRRAHGQARRRRLAGRYRPLPDRARDSGLRPPRPDAAVGAPAGRLQGAGQDHRRRATS